MLKRPAAYAAPQAPLLAAGVLILWGLYVVFYTLDLPAPGDALLELLPGALAVALLLWGGFSPGQLYLRLAPLSQPGARVLAAQFLVLAVVVLPVALTGGWIGFHPLAFLLFAPLGALAQETFFRAALLPALDAALAPRRRLALGLQALLFSLWHVPLAWLAAPVAPLPAVISVAVVTFFAGLGWGWQVRRDRTLVWAFAQHSLFLMVMSLFGL